MRTMKVFTKLTIFAALAAIVGLLVTGPSVGPVSADTVAKARGYAYGASEAAVSDPDPRAPEAEAVVPPPPEQEQLQTKRDRDELLNVLGLVRAATVEADACVTNGTPAKLQLEINRARILARGDTPAADADTDNNGPKDEDPERGDATPAQGFNDGCMRPGRVAPERPNESPSPSGSPSASPSASPTGGFQPGSPSPSASGSGSASPSPSGPPLPNCEAAVTNPTATTFTGPHCRATLPLWHSRGYARAVLAPLIATSGDIFAEAVARCENGKEIFSTGARLTGTIGGLSADRQKPNQPLSLPIGGGAVATYWETNWDPRTNSTTDGSDTVWVNGLHIITPVDDIILSHAEASADCPQGPVPAGGFPRDINIQPSKNNVLFGRTFTLSGSVTPATEFQTPRNCVEGVRVTIRRDIVGGPQDFVDVGSVMTDNRGNFTFNYKADQNAQWLAFIDKNNPTDCALSASSAKPVLVKPFVKLNISQQDVPRGKPVRLTASIAPCGEHAGTRMKLKRQYGASMVEDDTKNLDPNCKAVFIVQTNYDYAVYQAAWPKQDEDHQTGKSRRKVVRTR